MHTQKDNKSFDTPIMPWREGGMDGGDDKCVHLNIPASSTRQGV